MTTQECTKCFLTLPLDSFQFRTDNNKYRSYCKQCRSDQEVARRYKLTAEQLEQLRTDHNDCCAICNIHSTDIIHKAFYLNPLVVDHDHESGKVRGLLCPSCNVLLGHAKDDIQRLKKAAEYLLRHKE